MSEDYTIPQQRRARAPRRIVDREHVVTQTLEDAIARVRRNCAIALETRGEFSSARAMDLLHPVNSAYLEGAIATAQTVLDAEAAA